MYRMLLIAWLMSGCANIVTPPPVGREGGWWCNHAIHDSTFNMCTRTRDCVLCEWENTAYCFAVNTPDNVLCYSDENVCQQNANMFDSATDCSAER